jgi:DNA-binding transcriptional regulator GbsR (MarR family)
MNLTPVMQKYVLHWGEMGARWGMNRSIAQIHALLFLADEPLCSEDIGETLKIARSNVSNSLKELQTWELVKLVHRPLDRRDYFEAKQDPWDMLITIIEGRKRREIDPTLEMLAALDAEASADPQTPASVKAKIKSMHGFIGKVSTWYDQMRATPRPVLMKLLDLGAKITTFIGR